MNQDELFDRLRRHDPATGVPVNPANGPRAAALMEQIMQTDLNPTSHPETPAPRRRRRLWLALGGVGIVAVAVAGFVALRGDEAQAPTSMSISMAPVSPGGAAGSSCVRVDSLQPAPGTVAFRGTVVSIDGGNVTLDVTKWYANGTTDEVVVTTGTGDGTVDPELSATFEQGGDYLVAAADGQVSGCGMTGPYSAELDALYQGWFPAP
jgi:hypothetical protein